MGSATRQLTPTPEVPQLLHVAAKRGPAVAAVLSKPKGRLFANLLWSLVTAAAFAGGWQLAKNSSKNAAKEALPPNTGLVERDPAAILVTVEPVTYRPVQRTIEAVGTLHGFEEVSICAKVGGRVHKLCFDVADSVKPGELLFEIDPTDSELSLKQAEEAFQVELAKLGLTKLPSAVIDGADIDLETIPMVMQAKARLENAQAHYDRDKRLAVSQAVSAEQVGNDLSDYLSAQAEHDNQVLIARSGLATIQMKQAAVAVARQQLKDTQVRVPALTQPVPGAADGAGFVVTGRSVEDGTLVQAGTEVYKLVINQTLKLHVPIPERYGAEVRLGQKVDVSTGAIHRTLTGTVTRINPAVDIATRTFDVEIQVPNANGELKPGSFAKTSILTRLDAAAATAPLSALVNSVGIDKIFLLENGRAKEVQVVLGVETSEWVEIAKPDLPHGAQVITSGQSTLANDAPVALRAATDTATAPDASKYR